MRLLARTRLHQQPGRARPAPGVRRHRGTRVHAAAGLLTAGTAPAGPAFSTSSWPGSSRPSTWVRQSPAAPVEGDARNRSIAVRLGFPAYPRPPTSSCPPPDLIRGVPGIHVPPPARPLPAHTAMPQDVDARNKPGHDGRGTPPRIRRRFRGRAPSCRSGGSSSPARRSGRPCRGGRSPRRWPPRAARDRRG